MTGRQESAIELDGSIDALITSPDAPRPVDEGELTATARLLRESLPRFHPSFSFEEHLARRLAVLRRSGTRAAAPAPVRPLRPGAAPAPETALDAGDRRRRGLVAGGAIASGVSLAIPIAGAAIVVWRRSRSSGGLL